MSDEIYTPPEVWLTTQGKNILRARTKGGLRVDWHDTPYVWCDTPCFALREPVTPDEIKAALYHWEHCGCLGGCAHGR